VLRLGGPAFTQLLDVLAESVTIRDRSGSIIYANRAALGSMGFATLEELQRRPSPEIMSDYIVEDERGEPLTIDDVPSVRLLREQPAEPLLMRTLHKQTGRTRWTLLKATALRDEHDQVIAALTLIEDVTAVKEAELQTRVLAESGRILASSLDYHQTLENVANLAVPALADWCAVDLISDGGEREHVTTAHRDPAKRALARQLRALESNRLDPASALARVAHTGVSELFEEITDDQLVASARSAQHLEMLRAIGFRSALLVPLRVPARTIGVMSLVTAESRRRLTNDDVELAEQLGRRAAVAVENARLHTTLAQVAATLQQSLLPAELPPVPGWDVAALYRPASSEQRIDVGGDFYEMFAADSGFFCVVGDVTGKGVAAAALTSLIRHGARFASRLEPQPAAILRRLDEALRERPATSLCTALCAHLNGQQLCVSSAGHPPAMIVNRNGVIRETPQTGPLLGAFNDSSWPEESITVRGEELVLLYTDGVVDAPGPHGRFGAERLRALLADSAGCSPQEMLDRLEAALDAFCAHQRYDDVVALALRPAGR
jgi:PAS domain S-box-containing protein